MAASLSRLLPTGADRLAVFQSVDWEKAFGWLKAKTGADLAPSRPTRCSLRGPAGPGNLNLLLQEALTRVTRQSVTG